ncbi:hypothetical protein E4L40_02360 [Pseudomonas putida]|nr:hypothetical protein E4L40_02360 [Pseudomonas putida]
MAENTQAIDLAGPCRSGLTRECEGDTTDAFAGKPAPTGPLVLLTGRSDGRSPHTSCQNLGIP